MSRFAIKERQTLGKWVSAIPPENRFQHKGERQNKDAPKSSRLRRSFIILSTYFLIA